jgi:hypothetical protein
MGGVKSLSLRDCADLCQLKAMSATTHGDVILADKLWKY